MSSLILPSAVAALTHTRLSELSDALRRKVEATARSAGTNPATTLPVAVRDVERRVLALADAARDGFRGGTTAVHPAGRVIDAGFSREAIAGAIAWEWPAYAQAVNRPSMWMSDAMRRGSASPADRRVVVPTTDFALELGLKLRTDAANPAEARRAFAFSLGLMSGVATGAVMSPIQRGLHESTTRRPYTRHQPGGAVRAAERLVLRDLVGGRHPAADWMAWLPAAGETPDAWYQAYLTVADTVYGFGAASDADLARFIDGFTRGDTLHGADLRVGYEIALLDARLSSWDVGGWYAVLLPMLIAQPLALAVGRGLNHSKAFFTPATPDERSRFELLMAGMTFGTLAPGLWSALLASQVPSRGALFGEVIGIKAAQLVLGIISMAGTGTEWGPGARWGALYTLTQAGDLTALVRGIIALADHQRFDGFVQLLQLYPTASGLLSLVFGELFNAAGVEDDGVFVGILIALTIVIFLAGGLPLAFNLAAGGPLRWILDPEARFSPTAGLADHDAGVANVLARVFDESTLWRDPAAAGTAALGEFRYPAQGRALLRIWWTGTGNLEIAHDEHLVRFRVDGGPEIPVSFGPADITPNALMARLVDSVGAAGELHIEVVHTDAATTRLPFPSVLADPGDSAIGLAAHDAAAASFRPVGTTSDDAYQLRHGPDGELTTGFGHRGEATGDPAGFTLAPITGKADLAMSGVGMAADLSTLLCMGAAQALAPVPPEAAVVAGRPNVANPVSEPVNQVFRRWNLDDRRVNEWRMLVAGGARSEKVDPITDPDPAMRTPVAGYAVHAPQGEPVATAMGWLPAFRAWTRVAADLAADTDAAQSERYTPDVDMPDGARRRPTNRELSSAVRFLLDLR